MTWETPEQRQARLYAQEVGKKSADRQKWLAVDHYPCCGERYADGHHIACSKRPADEPVTVHEGQETFV